MQTMQTKVHSYANLQNIQVVQNMQDMQFVHNMQTMKNMQTCKIQNDLGDKQYVMEVRSILIFKWIWSYLFVVFGNIWICDILNTYFPSTFTTMHNAPAVN